MHSKENALDPQSDRGPATTNLPPMFPHESGGFGAASRTQIYRVNDEPKGTDDPRPTVSAYQLQKGPVPSLVLT
jgi:hypothetical protein